MSTSKFVYIVMAQALDEKIPPFILQMFGTNAAFSTQDVVNRWHFTKSELQKFVQYTIYILFVLDNPIHNLIQYIFRFGIELAGVSSDGDPKLLSAMIYEASHPENGIFVVQDTIHLGNKLRNRMLKPDIILPMGTHRVSIQHMKSLVKDVQKSIHGLTQHDICPEDKMNFDSFQKITQDRVIQSLQKYVKNSEATVQYLKVCKDLTSSFLELDLAPLDRIFRSNRGLFFLRIWRQNIKNSKFFRLMDNFISSNAYSCAEINIKNLIELLKKYRDQNKPQSFLPTVFNSQTCEQVFRLFRSMGTTQFTKINFTLYELLHMIGRIEVQNEIAYFKLVNQEISFPNKRAGKTKIYNLPSDEEINAIILKAKEEAIKDATKFGMDCFEGIEEYEFHSKLVFNAMDDEYSDDENERLNAFEEIENEEWVASEELGKFSPFVAVNDEDGVPRIIRKSTLLWMLTEPSEKLSKDRLRRVQVNTKKRKMDPK